MRSTRIQLAGISLGILILVALLVLAPAPGSLFSNVISPDEQTIHFTSFTEEGTASWTVVNPEAGSLVQSDNELLLTAINPVTMEHGPIELEASALPSGFIYEGSITSTSEQPVTLELRSEDGTVLSRQILRAEGEFQVRDTFTPSVRILLEQTPQFWVNLNIPEGNLYVLQTFSINPLRE